MKARGNSSDLPLRIFHHTQLGDFRVLRELLRNANETDPNDLSVIVNLIDPLTTDSPLMMACRKGYSDIVRLFLSYGAKNDPHPEYGQTALHAAVSERQTEIVSVLLEVAEESDADSVICNLADPEGQTALHIASILGISEIVELLLLHGADLTCVDSHGHSPLHLSAGSGSVACLAAILDHGGDFLLENKDNLGNTALHHASFYGQLECVRLLVETAADVLARNNQGQTAYSLASSRGYREICSLLLEYREHHTAASAAVTRPKPIVNPALSRFESSSRNNYFEAMLPQPPAATRSSSAVQTTPSIMPPPYSDDMYVRNGGLSSLQDNKEMSIDINLKTPAHNHGFIHDSYSPFLQDTSHKPMPQQYRRSVSEPFTMGIDLPRPHTMNSPPLNGHAVKNSPVLKNGYKVLPKEETFSLKATPEKSLLHSSQQQQRPSPITLSERSSSFNGNILEKVPTNTEVLAGPIPVMTKQNASLKPATFPVSSDPFRSFVQKMTSNNISTNSMTSLNNSDVQSNKESKSKKNLTVSVSSPPKKEKMYAFDDMSPSRSGAFRDRVTAAGDLFGEIHSAFNIMRTPMKKPLQSSIEVDNFEYSTIYKNADAENFEIVRNTPLFPSQGPSRCPSRATSRAPSPAPVPQDVPVEATTSQFADPIEVFTTCGADWHSYLTEDGDLYYLILATGHSQWEDPRLSGLVLFDYEQEQQAEGADEDGPLNISVGSISRSSIKSPPTSPSPKSPSPSLVNENISDVKHEVHNPFTSINHVSEERRPSFSSAPLEKEGSVYLDEKELLSFTFDGISVARNFRWVDDNSDTSLFANEKETPPHESEVQEIEAQQVGSIGIADIRSPVIEVDTKEFEKTSGEEFGPESQSSTASSPKFEIISNFSPSTETDSIFPPMSPTQFRQYEAKLNFYLKQSELISSVQQLRDFMEENHESEELILKVLELIDESKTGNRNLSRTPSNLTSSEESGRTSPLIFFQGQETAKKFPVENTVLKKYAKMYSLGVPLENVLMRMKLDSLSAQYRNKLLNALGKREMESEESPLIISKNSLLTKSRGYLGNMNWKPLATDKLRKSVWVAEDSNLVNDITADDNTRGILGRPSTEVMEEEELRELKKLFKQQSTAQKAAPSAQEKLKYQDTQNKLILLDRSRAQNISIGLLAFKEFGSTTDFLRSIITFDTVNGRITADVLDNFQYLLPTESELKKLRVLQVSYHPAEVFMQEVASFYPELPLKLLKFRTCLTLESECRGAITKNKNIVNTCNQILSSGKLAKLLKKMLAIGNIMNQGTSRSDAHGVSLDSLLQMIHIKGIDKKTTILDYVVKNLYDKGEESLLTIVKDLHLLDDYSKLSARESLEEVAAINGKLADLERECSNGRNHLNHNRPPSSRAGDHYHANEHSELHDFSSTADMTGAKNPPMLDAPRFNPQSTSKVLVSQFSINLENSLIVFRDIAKEVNRSADILCGKLNELVEYFGEEPNVCDTVQIFGALQQFKVAVACSKDNAEWRISRASNNHSSSSGSSNSSSSSLHNSKVIAHTGYSET